MIYFVRDPGADVVKIGFSDDPWRRFGALQTASASKLFLELVATGGQAEERALHRRFSAERVRGEWFRWRGAVAQHVASLAPIAPPAPSRDSRKTQVNRALVTLGYTKQYGCELHSGRRAWTFPLAIGVWRLTGHKVGPIVHATDAELVVLEKYHGTLRHSLAEAA